MAFKNNPEVLFVRVPMSTKEKNTIEEACAKTGMKKYEWIRRALLAEATKKEVVHD